MTRFDVSCKMVLPGVVEVSITAGARRSAIEVSVDKECRPDNVGWGRMHQLAREVTGAHPNAAVCFEKWWGGCVCETLS